MSLVADLLKQAPYWTALRCRLVFADFGHDELTLDVVMAADQPDNSDWDAPAGTPLTVVATTPSEAWLRATRPTIEEWVAQGSEIEIRRTRRWEKAGGVLAWSRDSSLLLDLVVET